MTPPAVTRPAVRYTVLVERATGRAVFAKPVGTPVPEYDATTTDRLEDVEHPAGSARWYAGARRYLALPLEAAAGAGVRIGVSADEVARVAAAAAEGAVSSVLGGAAEGASTLKALADQLAAERRARADAVDGRVPKSTDAAAKARYQVLLKAVDALRQVQTDATAAGAAGPVLNLTLALLLERDKKQSAQIAQLADALANLILIQLPGAYA